MKAKSLYVLIAAAVVALVLALWIGRTNQPVVHDSNDQGTPLVPDLRDQINDINTIAFSGVDAASKVTLKREADGWHVAEKSNYPADVSKVRQFLLKLADATVIEQKTANPKRYAELGVDDIATAGSKAVEVDLGGLKQPVKLLLGLFNGQGGGGTFVRKVGEAQSLLVSGTVLAEKDASAWIRHEIIDIDAARIKDIELTDLQDAKLHVYKEQSADNNFRVADVPKGRVLASDFIANSLGSGLANLRADDVAAAQDAPAPEKAYKAHYLAFGGLAVDVVAWDDNGKMRIQLVTSNDAAQLDADIAAEQAKAKAAYETAVAAAKLKVNEAKGDVAAINNAAAEVAKPPSIVDATKDRNDRLVAAAKVVDDLNRSIKGWTFTVPLYEFSNFNKRMDDLLKPLDSGKPVVKMPAPNLSGVTAPGPIH